MECTAHARAASGGGGGVTPIERHRRPVAHSRPKLAALPGAGKSSPRSTYICMTLIAFAGGWCRADDRQGARAYRDQEHPRIAGLRGLARLLYLHSLPGRLARSFPSLAHVRRMGLESECHRIDVCAVTRVCASRCGPSKVDPWTRRLTTYMRPQRPLRAGRRPQRHAVRDVAPDWCCPIQLLARSPLTHIPTQLHRRVSARVYSVGSRTRNAERRWPRPRILRCGLSLSAQ